MLIWPFSRLYVQECFFRNGRFHSPSIRIGADNAHVPSIFQRILLNVLTPANSKNPTDLAEDEYQ